MSLESPQPLERQLTGRRTGTRQCLNKFTWYTSRMRTQTCIILLTHTMQVCTTRPTVLSHILLRRPRPTDLFPKATRTMAPMLLRRHPRQCLPHTFHHDQEISLQQKSMTGTPQTERWTPENFDRSQGVFLNTSLGSHPSCSTKDPSPSTSLP